MALLVLPVNNLLAQSSSIQSPVLACNVYCDERGSRTGVAEISLLEPGNLPTSAAKGSQALAGDARRMMKRLDVTIFSNGFAENMYRELSGRPVTAGVAQSSFSDGRLEKLRAFQLELKTERPNTMRLSQQSTGAVFDAEPMMVIGNLEPGINYFWRAVFENQNNGIFSATVSCIAPVCPADMVKEAN